MKFLCPNCKKKYRVPDSQLPTGGAQINCKRCNTRFRVLRPDDSDPSAVNEPASGGLPAAIAVADDASDGGSKKIDPFTVDQYGATPQNAAAGYPEAALSLEQQQLNQLIDQNDTQAAAQLLLELIKSAIADRDFQQAESWRDKIYEVAPDALNESVIANELIEEGKAQAIDQSHLGIFRALYNRLDPEEANAFYFALKKVTVKSVRQILSKKAGSRSRPMSGWKGLPWNCSMSAQPFWRRKGSFWLTRNMNSD